MIDVALVIKGQDGLNWTRWQRLAQAAEDLGFAGLYRSDHFINPSPPNKDTLELWTSLTWLAGHTKRIEFGPLVSPVSFRDPVVTAHIARDVDDLSGGRLHLGMGAGWSKPEHKMFGYDLLDVPERFKRFQEGLEVVTRLLRSKEPISFEGGYYTLDNALLLPRPQRPGGPPIVIGGNGRKRTLPLVAKYANEWNSVFIPPDKFKALNVQLNDLTKAEGRAASDIKRSMMSRVIFGRDEKELAERVQAETIEEMDAAEVRQEWGALVGTGDEIVAQLGELAEAGIYRVMLQWIALDDLDRLEAMANAVLPQL